METTIESRFDDLGKFLANVEFPEVFANLWIQFQNAVPDIRSEATVHFYSKSESASSGSYRFTWTARHGIWSQRGIEHHGFIETVEQLKTVAKARAHSIQTNLYRGVFFSDDSQKRVVGFLYFPNLRSDSS